MPPDLKPSERLQEQYKSRKYLLALYDYRTYCTDMMPYMLDEMHDAMKVQNQQITDLSAQNATLLQRIADGERAMKEAMLVMYEYLQDAETFKPTPGSARLQAFLTNEQ
jgi:hypothetical protein